MRIILVLFLGIIFNHKKIEAFLFNTVTKNLNCNQASSSKYLIITSTKSNLPNDCVYTIRAHSMHVCQLRLDFDIELMQPIIPSVKNTLTYVDCNSEYMEVGHFKLCGSNRNQHVYIPFNRTDGITEINIRMHTVASSSSFWKLKLNQLECAPNSSIKNALSAMFQPKDFIKNAYLIAPNGCTQYFPEMSGTITSFNYMNELGVYPGNLTYSICFRITTNRETLRLTADHFQIGHEPTDLVQMDASCVPNFKTPGRSEDFLFVPGAIISTLQLRANYFCGKILNEKIITSNIPGPLYIVFSSDDMYSSDIQESGFSFKYSIN